MKLALTSDKDEFLKLSFFIDDIIDAVLKTEIGDGSPQNPIILDAFIKNRLSGMPVVTAGTRIELILDPESSKQINPRLIYGAIRNITKGFSGYMDVTAWQEYFDWDTSDPLYVVGPNGHLYISPDSNGACSILSKESQQNIFIAYGAVITFMINNRNYFFRVDPLAKISSGKDIK